MPEYRAVVIGFPRTHLFFASTDHAAKTYASRHVATVFPGAAVRVDKSDWGSWHEVAYKMPSVKTWFVCPPPGAKFWDGPTTIEGFILLHTRRKRRLRDLPVEMRLPELSTKEQLRLIDKQFDLLERDSKPQPAPDRRKRAKRRDPSHIPLEEMLAEMQQKADEHRARQAARAELAAKAKSDFAAHRAANTARADDKRAKTAARKAERIANRKRKPQ